MPGVPHLGWIPAGAAVGFAVAFLLGDAEPVPVVLYHAVYFAAVLGFLAFYARTTGLDLAARAGRRLVPALLLGLLGGAVLVAGVLGRPGSPFPPDAVPWGDLLWRGILYGAVDGLLLLAFPWLVAWRALGAEEGGWRRKALASAVAYAGVLLVTTAYHLGYADFRSRQIVQPNVGATLGAVPTLVSANPVAGPVSHVALHVAAVLHVPDSDLYLPPHR